MLLGITFLSYNDNFTLFYTLKQFFKNTEFNLKTNIYILIQNCSPSYRRSLESLINLFKKSYSTLLNENLKIVNFETICLDENIGLSKANNLLYEKSKECDCVLHIEDDWIIKNISSDWLDSCINLLKENSISTILLRAYGNEKEEYKYGWSRNIPYMCHSYTDNFNYKNKIDFNNPLIRGPGPVSKIFNYYNIPNFLFTFNPCIRVNKDYVEKGVYPLIEFEDKDTIQYFDIDSTKIHDSPSWGFCEALTMEKTRNLNSVWFENGIFYHQDDNLDILEKECISIFSNDFEGIYNVNCHIPILLIHLDDFNTHSIKHDFLCSLHFYLKNKIDENKIKNFRKILSKYSPKCLITIGEKHFLNNFVNFMKFIPFE
jgi:hypothetical protein